MLLATDLMESQDIKISMRGVEGCQSSNMVQKWSDMYRDQGGYISTCCDWGRKRSSKEIDRCPLTSPLFKGMVSRRMGISRMSLCPLT
jgi:hypothetical protein